jgi:hypothetical protein
MTPRPTTLGNVAALPGKAAYAAPVFDYLRRNPAFANQTVVVNFPGSPEESAALGYLILTATGTRGETMTGDGLQNQTGEVAVSFTVNGQPQTINLPAFTDSWGTPIYFSRHTFIPGELNGPDFSKAKQAPNVGGPFRDPVDPLGKLVTPTVPQNNSGWTVGNTLQYSLQQFWSALYPATSPHWNYDGAFPASYKVEQFSQTPPAAGPWNWTPTFVSAGPNKKLATAAGANFGGDDDQFSFRLAREGNRGN